MSRIDRARQGQPVPVRRARRAPTATTRSSPSSSPSRLADELTLEAPAAPRTRSSAPASTGPNLAARGARRLPRGQRLGRRRRAPHDRQARPGRRRDGRRLGRRRRRAAARRARPPAAPTTRCSPSSRRRSAPTSPSSSHGGRALVTGIGEHVEPLPPGPPAALVILPVAHDASARRRSTRRPTASRPPAPTSPRAERDVRAGALPTSTTSSPPRSRCARRSTQRLDAAHARRRRHVLVAGSGPTVFGAFDDPERAAAAARSCPARSSWSRVKLLALAAGARRPRRARPRSSHEHGALGVDRAAFDVLDPLRSRTGVDVVRVLTDLGSLPVAALVAVAGALYADRARPPRRGARARRSACSSSSCSSTLGKELVGPPAARRTASTTPAAPRIPSGHSAYAIAWLAAARG